MRTTPSTSSALALAAVVLGGCATSYVPADHWTYRGTDEALRSPPRVPRGELTGSEWIEALRASETLWWKERQVHIEHAKEGCARDTGESKTPGYWFGYSRAFKVCMEAHGWSEGRNPI
jgi:hypothetical protein